MELRAERKGAPHAARLVDISLAGAGLELDGTHDLAPGERLTVAIATPALWDPLQVPAVVAWTMPARGRDAARAGVTFRHAGPDSVFATWEMLSSLVFE